MRLLKELESNRESSGLKPLEEITELLKKRLQDNLDLVILLLNTGARYVERSKRGLCEKVMSELASKKTGELLALHAAAMEKLRESGVLRSANNPTGDLAEYLFCEAFGWSQENNSAKGFDATAGACPLVNAGRAPGYALGCRSAAGEAMRGSVTT